MAKETAIRASWYDYPQYYDCAYESETRQEADFIEAAFRKYCQHPVRRLLEPACGTGRLLRLLAARGYRMTGLDTSAAALSYLHRRLTPRGLHATLLQADMADFCLAKPVDAAYCTVSSFLHLLSEDAAHRHLECVGKSLRPEGIYILGIELTPSHASRHTTQRWTQRHGRTKITFTQRVIATDWRRRLETIRMSLLVRREKNVLRLRDEYQLRLYTAAHFQRLLSSVSSLETCGVYDFACDIDHPIELNAETSYMLLILRKRAGK